MGGGGFNLTFVGPIPIPGVSISGSITENAVSTAVTNKIIHRSGIVEQVIAYTDGSIKTTKNLFYDDQTGRVVLNTVNNNFDDPIYNYTLPAHQSYELMGSAYQNGGLKFDVNAIGLLDYFLNIPTTELPNSFQEILKEGDEYILSDDDTKVKGIYLGYYQLNDNSTGSTHNFILNQATNLTSPITFTSSRSGYRNLLSNNIETIVALVNPITERTSISWPCGLWIFEPNGYISPGNQPNYSMPVLNNVINIAATTYGDLLDPNATSFTTNNPFSTGEKGIWRSHQLFMYDKDRNYKFKNINALNSNSLILTDEISNLSGDGLMSDVPLFVWDIIRDKDNYNSECPLLLDWHLTKEVTQYSPYGYELENRNILDVYSCAYYGYDHTLPVLVANNSKYEEVFFESFEDPSSNLNTNTTKGGHTGKNASSIHSISLQDIVQLENDEEYVLSLWVSKDNANIHTYEDEVTVTIGNTSCSPAGRIINGWQRIYCVFSGQGESPNITINGTDYKIDDIRIYPADANIQTYVYDPNTLRLSATLDENNYATLYHYDEEGQLFLIKKETVDGIKTIQETRSYTAPTE